MVGTGLTLLMVFCNLYHLSTLKNHYNVDVLLHGGSMFSLSFEFFRPLSNRDTIEASLLFLYWGMSCLDKGIIHRFGGSLCLASCSLSYQYFGLILEEVVSLVWHFLCTLCWRGEEDLDHLFWSCDYAPSVWNYFFGVFDLQLSSHESFSDMFEVFLLHLSFVVYEKGSSFLWKLGVSLCFQVFPLVQNLSSNVKVPLESEIVLGKSFPSLSANTSARMLARAFYLLLIWGFSGMLLWFLSTIMCKLSAYFLILLVHLFHDYYLSSFDLSVNS